jgi:predicted peroxiredoxin
MPENTSNILYVLMSGIETPERLYAPFLLGSTAAAMGIETTVYFLIKGVTVVKNGEAEKIKLGQFPNLKDVMEQAIESGVRLMVCEQSCMLLGIEKGDFIPEASIVGAATLNDLLLKSDAVLSF